MSNIKVTAALLETAGYTEAQIDRYFKILDRKATRGHGSLTVSDRRFNLAAQAACNKVAAAQAAEVKAAQKRATSGKQPVETKLHYRWVATEISLLPTFTELAIGEMTLAQIWAEEVCRALSIYQPVLDQIDTSKRGAFTAPRAEISELVAGIGRRVQFDRAGYLAQFRAQFPENWNPQWNNYHVLGADIALSGDDIVEVRALVRSTVEDLTRTVYPSVTAAA